MAAPASERREASAADYFQVSGAAIERLVGRSDGLVDWMIEALLSLPRAEAGGVEVRLAVPRGLVDVAIQYRKGSGMWRRLVRDGGLPEFLRGVPERLDVLDFVEDLWVEFDEQASGGYSPQPCLFVGLAEGSTANLALLRSILALVGRHGDAEPVSQALSPALPHAQLLQLGVLQREDRVGYRACLSGLTLQAAADLAAGCGLNTLVPRIASLAELAEQVDEIVVGLDIHDGVVLPRVGVELSFAGARVPHFHDRWRTLFHALEARGLACQQATSRASTWFGVEALGLQLHGGMVAPTSFPVLLRGCSHVKVTVAPGHEDAKAYFGFRQDWNTSVCTPRRPSRSIPKRLDSGSVGAAVGAGVHFLECACDPNGLWRDFLLASGESDEWVSGFVATQLARTGLRGRLAVEAAAQALLARRPFLAGWGFNGIVPPDADSTAWVLQALAAAGHGNTPAAQDGRSLLCRHQRDGGICTYLDPRAVFQHMGRAGTVAPGWTAPHVTVTAATVLATGRPALAGFLLGKQDVDGSFRGYWWESVPFSTCLAAEALARLGEGDAVRRAADWACTRLRQTDPGPFETASLVRVLLVDFTPSRLELVAVHLRNLLLAQRDNGSWEPGAWLRVPDPESVAPSGRDAWKEGGIDIGSRILDRRAVFTTAWVVGTLSKALATIGGQPGPVS